jgi:hypothetical protein
LELDSETPKTPKIRPVGLPKDEKQISKHAPNQFFRSLLEGSPGLAAQGGSLRLTAIARQMAADLSTSLLAVFLSIWSRKAKPTHISRTLFEHW